MLRNSLCADQRPVISPLQACSSNQIPPAPTIGHTTGTWALRAAKWCRVIPVQPANSQIVRHRARTLAPCRLSPAVVTPCPHSPPSSCSAAYPPAIARFLRPERRTPCSGTCSTPPSPPPVSDSLSPSSGVPLRPRLLLGSARSCCLLALGPRLLCSGLCSGR